MTLNAPQELSRVLPAGPSETPVDCVCLIVLDGWGHAPAGPGNAISLARTPVFDELWESYPHTQLTAGGRSVGLPEGQMGNSEVGHLNLGAGAIVPQDLARIDAAIDDGSFADNRVLRRAFAAGSRVHLVGLVSDGGVHSSLRHLHALIEMAARDGCGDLVIHAFTDGRDTLPDAGAGHLETVERWCAEAGTGRVGSVVGRFHGMDRDRRWDRTQRAYDMLVHGRAEHRAASGPEALRAAYDRGESDEFVTPTLVGDDARIRTGDSVICFDFRPDRMREITCACAEHGFDAVDRHGAAPVEMWTTLTEYREGWDYPVAFAPERPATTLAALFAERGVAQLHVAESEKYPHVTYFFNGGVEDEQPGEVRELIPSPRDVPTYDQEPEMSAPQVAEAFVRQWTAVRPGFAIVNYANADMVGHTGVIPAAIRGIETIDEVLAETVTAVHESGGVCIVTADHGNADHMLEPDGGPNTAHSLNPVPLIVTLDGGRVDGPGILADVAPTALALLGLEQPPEMTGRSLLA